MTMEFASLEDLAHHLTRDTVGGLLNVRKGLQASVELLEDAAKGMIGHYQDQHGPMQDWAPLSPATEEAKAAHGYPTDAPLLASGAMRESITHEVEDWEATMGATDPKMEFHEFGTAKIPPRPVIGQALYQNIAKVQRLIGNAAVSGFVGGDPIHPDLGYEIEGQAD